jgi:acetyl-CoA carboxylase carboxyl transferase subunit beta
MSWLSRVVKPKIRALVQPSSVPDNLWHKCEGCGSMLFRKDYAAASAVCHHCGHHGKLSPEERFALLFDEKRFTVLDAPRAPHDPLKFKDTKRYADRLKEARNKTGRADALVAAHGHILGRRCVVAVFDFAFMAGSMGAAVGEGIVKAAEAATAQRAALLIIPASGGARMQEGIVSLMQMARTTAAVQGVRAARLPYMVLLANPTTGGVTASFAMLGDVTLAEPGAVIGFAGARVIEETIRQKLPDGFQRSEYLLEHGMVDRIVPRADQRREIGALLGLLGGKAA